MHSRYPTASLAPREKSCTSEKLTTHSQHLQKLKRKEPGGAAAGADGGPKTPAKRGGRGGGASGSKRKAKAIMPVQDDDDLGEEIVATPTKKPRMRRGTDAKAETAEPADPLQSEGVKNEQVLLFFYTHSLPSQPRFTSSRLFANTSFLRLDDLDAAAAI